MITIEEFALWIKENTTLSDSSIYKYSHAVKNVSKDMITIGVIPMGLFEMSALQCEYWLPVILNHPSFINKDKIGNKMYSNALKQYRMFRLSVSDEAVDRKEIADAIPNYETLSVTEKTAVVKSRVGQGIFRKRLLEKYNSTCIITGVVSKKLLIASHIRPWAVSSNEDRLSAENGLLLSPTYDRLFDYGLITFSNEGGIIVSSYLPPADAAVLRLTDQVTYDLKISQKMKEHLDYHRDMVFAR